MSAANRGARYGLETPSSYGRIFRKREFLRPNFFGLFGGVGGDFRAVGRRGAAGGGFCDIQKTRGAPAGSQGDIRENDHDGGADKEGTLNFTSTEKRLVG